MHWFGSKDHYIEAMEDGMPGGRGYEEGYTGYTRSSNNFHYDPLHYHTRVEFDEIVHTTQGAFLFRIESRNYWVPKALCKNMGENSVWILTHFNLKPIKEKNNA